MVNLNDLVNDQGELALSIELDEKGNPVQVCGYGNPQRGDEFTAEEKRDLFLAASLNEEKTHDDEGKLMLDAYLTDRLENATLMEKNNYTNELGIRLQNLPQKNKVVVKRLNRCY